MWIDVEFTLTIICFSPFCWFLVQWMRSLGHWGLKPSYPIGFGVGEEVWKRGLKRHWGLQPTIGRALPGMPLRTRRSLCCCEKSRSEPSNALGVFQAPTTSGCFLRWQNHCWTKQFPSPFGRPTTFCSGTGITISFLFVFVIWSLPPWWRMMIMSCLFSFSRSLDTSPTMLSSSPSFTQPHEQTQLRGPGNFNFANFFFFFDLLWLLLGLVSRRFYSSGDA